MKLEEALRAFAVTVEVDGAEGDGQLAAELGNMGGEGGWRLNESGEASGAGRGTRGPGCLCGVEGQSEERQGVRDEGAGSAGGAEGSEAGSRSKQEAARGAGAAPVGGWIRVQVVSWWSIWLAA